jgi:hypothetical protein
VYVCMCIYVCTYEREREYVRVIESVPTYERESVCGCGCASTHVRV